MIIERIDSIEHEPNNIGELLWIMRRTSITRKQFQEIAGVSSRKIEDLLIFIGLRYPIYEDARGNLKLLTAAEIEEENRRQTEETRRKLIEKGLAV